MPVFYFGGIGLEGKGEGKERDRGKNDSKRGGKTGGVKVFYLSHTKRG